MIAKLQRESLKNCSSKHLKYLQQWSWVSTYHAQQAQPVCCRRPKQPSPRRQQKPAIAPHSETPSCPVLTPEKLEPLFQGLQKVAKVASSLFPPVLAAH